VLFADLTSFACSGDCLQEFVADPELQYAVGDQDVAGAAGIMLADADLLVTDTDDAVAADLSADPLLAVALGSLGKAMDVLLGLVETNGGCLVTQRLVGSGVVVVAHPLVESRLGDLQGAEHPGGVELNAQGAVEALNLACRGGLARLGEKVVDAVLPADAVEEDLDWRPGELPGEYFAVVSQHLLGTSVCPQCGFESVAHQLGALPVRSRAETQKREWSSTPVSALALVHRCATCPPVPPTPLARTWRARYAASAG
jgi:hypothetical protein